MWTNPAPNTSIRALNLGDFNGDGRLDACVSDWKHNVYFINGLTGLELWRYSKPTDDCYDLAVGDYNNDGVDDVAICSLDYNIYAVAGYAPPRPRS